MARCVLTAAEPLADGPGRNAERRIERIEQARFADAGVAGEGAGLPAQCIAQLVDAEPRCRACAQDAKADGAVNSIEMIRRVKVALIEADDRLAVGIFRDGDHAVDQKRIGDGVDVRRDHDELVNIRHRRADERIAPRQDGVDAALAVRIEADLHTVADQRTAPVVPEAAAGLALHDLIAGGHIVKAAERLDDDTLHHKRCCSFISSLRLFRPVGDPDIDLAVLRELCVGRCALLKDCALLGVVGLFVRAAIAQAAALDARDGG